MRARERLAICAKIKINEDTLQAGRSQFATCHGTHRRVAKRPMKHHHWIAASYVVARHERLELLMPCLSRYMRPLPFVLLMPVSEAAMMHLGYRHHSHTSGCVKPASYFHFRAARKRILVRIVPLEMKAILGVRTLRRPTTIVELSYA